MKTFQQKSLLLASSLGLLLALGACDKGEQRSAGQKLDSMASRAKEEAQDAAARAKAAANKLGEGTKSMGAGAADKADDASITTKVNAALAADKDLSATKIDVDTKNGVVTLTGPAPSASAKDRATDIAKNVKGVSSVNNKLSVKAG
jgi:hyperosmotically inducible periplasmic protein